jgi:hypothetical protein
MINPLASALTSLRPGAEFSFSDQDIKSIVWHTEGVTTPTKKQIDDEIKRLEAEEAAAVQARIDAKASAIAKLEALGLNLAEAQAILG